MPKRDSTRIVGRSGRVLQDCEVVVGDIHVAIICRHRRIDFVGKNHCLAAKFPERPGRRSRIGRIV